MSTLQDNQQMKRCSKCRQELPVTDFSKSMLHASGYASNCKHCRRKQVQQKVMEKKKYADLYGY
jgi:hypothetical protein